jgi:Predicted signal transduction protein with a C-terminal ATPase domain
VFAQLILFLALIILPFDLLSAGIMYFSMRRISDDAIRETTDRLSIFANAIEDQLAGVNKMLLSLSIDEDVTGFSLMREQAFDYQQYVAYQKVMGKLQLIMSASPYFDDVFMLMPERDEELSAKKSMLDIESDKASLLRSSVSWGMAGTSYYSSGDLIHAVQGLNDTVLGVELSMNSVSSTLSSLEEGSPFRAAIVDPASLAILGGEPAAKMDRRIASLAAAAPPGSRRLSVGGEAYLYGSSISKTGLFRVVVFARESDLLTDFSFIKWLVWVAILGSLLALAAFYSLIRSQVHAPLQVLVASMHRVEAGDYSTRIDSASGSEFRYVYGEFNDMTSRLQQLIEEVLVKRIESQETHMLQLQARINPHFLYNCLFLGYRMAKSGDAGSVADLCLYLGDYFRFITYFSDNLVALRDELKFMGIYMKLQQMRFAGRLEYRLSVEEGLEDQELPSLVLQPLVENAILHGVEKVEARCALEVDIAREGERVCVRVEDGGKGMTPEGLEALRASLSRDKASTSTYGLWNIDARLKLLYGEGLRIESVEGSFFRVSFSVPAAVSPARGC